MTATPKTNLPFVLFQIREGLYAIRSENVREIVILPNVVSVPNAAREIRGVINLRGKVIPLTDLRVKMGLQPAKAELEELIQLLQDREKDHVNWLTDLEACVRERRPFKLARDPHACKFGLWYDRYQTDNSMLKMTLKKMEQPHQAIHASADQILQLGEQGKTDEAMEQLATRRSGELATLVRLFDEARRILHEHHRELAMVLDFQDKRFAISIDRVEAVERIPEESIQPMTSIHADAASQPQWRIGKRVKSNQPILILDHDFLAAA